MTVDTDLIKKVWKTAKCLIPEEQVENAIKRMGKEITADLQDSNPIVLSVMNGGLIFTGKLMLHLQFPLELSYIHASRYNNQTSGSELKMEIQTATDLTGRTVLIVDDILDVGKTLVALVDYCKQQGAKQVYSAVLVNKKHDRKAYSDFNADFQGLETEDHYLFGYGLDYKGYLRNANGIYAIAEEFYTS